MGTKTARSKLNKPQTPQVHAPVPLHWQAGAAIVGAAVAMQAFAWTWLWVVFGVARVGYGFFDVSDLIYYYTSFAVRMAQGLVPFRDFTIEYPPLFVPLLVAPGVHANLDSYVIRFAVFMVVLMAAACAVTAVAAFDDSDRRRAYLVAAVFSGYTLLLGPIAANRYDAAVALVLACILLFIVRDRWEAAATMIGIGFALKVTPAMLLPPVVLLTPRRRIVRVLVGFSVAAAVPFLWVLLLGGKAASALTYMFAYHLNRPLEIESVLAMPFWIGKLLGGTTVQVGLAAGSQVIVSKAADTVAALSSGVLLLALGVVFALIWRRRQVIAADPALKSLAVLATLLASLIGSKVLSPQYFVWVVPAVALVAVDRRVLGALMAAVLLLTQVEFPANYWAFADLQLPGAVAIVVVRNLLLVAAFAATGWYLWRIPADR